MIRCAFIIKDFSLVAGNHWWVVVNIWEGKQEQRSEAAIFSAGHVILHEVAVVTISGTERCSHLCRPICVSSCFISQVRQLYLCIRHSSKAPHGCGCKSSKRVQLSWQDAWKLSSDLATQEVFLSAVSSLGFCSHDMRQKSTLFMGKSSPKRLRRCLMQKQYSIYRT